MSMYTRYAAAAPAGGRNRDEYAHLPQGEHHVATAILPIWYLFLLRRCYGGSAVQEEKAGIALGKRVDGQVGAFSDGETTGARGGLMDSACPLRFSGSHG